MLISQIERRIIFQQIKFFKVTNNSYRTNAHRYTNINQTFLETQRHYAGGIKDFVETFKEKLDENIKQTPEFGGDLKRLSDSSSTASESIKQTGGKISESVEAVKKVSQQIIEPIAANPQVQEAAKKTVEATGVAAVRVGGIFAWIFDIFADTFILPAKNAYGRTKLKKNMDTVITYRFASTRTRFDPTPFDESLLDDFFASAKKKGATELVEHQEKQWDNLKGKVGQKWSDMGEGDTRLSVLIERADSYGSSLKKMSNSKITAVVKEIRTIFPNFRYKNFLKWLSKILFVRLLRGDSALFVIQSERIRKKFYDGVLPKPWNRVRVLHIDVYEHPDANYAFIFTLRGRAMCWEKKETENKDVAKAVPPPAPKLFEGIGGPRPAAPEEIDMSGLDPNIKVKPISFTISIAIKLNEMGFWQLTDYHEIEVAPAPF